MYRTGLFMLFVLTAGILTAEEYYAFTYFTGNGEDGLHMAVSRDGLKWSAVNDGKSIYKQTLPGDNLMRDPSICLAPDGIYHMVWTTSWKNRVIGHATSRDLIHWTESESVPVMMHEPTCRNTWAPEVFFDDASGFFYIIWASTIPGQYSQSGTSEDMYDHRLYFTKTKDFKSYEPTKLYFDPGYNVIDGFLAKKDKTYYLFYKDERLKPERKVILVATATTPEGPFTEGVVISHQSWVEGPTAIIINGQWLVLYDCYAAGRYGAIRSALSPENKNSEPGAVKWENVSDQLQLPKNVRHGTLFKIDQQSYEKLEAL